MHNHPDAVTTTTTTRLTHKPAAMPQTPHPIQCMKHHPRIFRQSITSEDPKVMKRQAKKRHASYMYSKPQRPHALNLKGQGIERAPKSQGKIENVPIRPAYKLYMLNTKRHTNEKIFNQNSRMRVVHKYEDEVALKTTQHHSRLVQIPKRFPVRFIQHPPKQSLEHPGFMPRITTERPVTYKAVMKEHASNKYSKPQVSPDTNEMDNRICSNSINGNCKGGSVSSMRAITA
ncbi:hypothetical protein O0L34_g5831 [Tuta absoluta]|nr:hypothetical protein O0L34_g5831 [Tuta absoluta]